MSGRAEPLVVNGARLIASIDALGAIGAGADGVCRGAFTEADRAGRAYVAGLMREAGLAVRVDPAGNMIGRREGTPAALARRARGPARFLASTGVGADAGASAPAADSPASPPAALGALAMGSHIDTVPSAGRFDGAYGVLAAIEVCRALAESGAAFSHPVEVIAFADEEGTRFPGGLFGSRAMAGSLAREIAEAACSRDPALASDVRASGGDLDRVAAARRAPGEVAAYLELHVEQGPVLARAGVAIGVVTGITGRRVYDVVVEGAANHAGTTPMDARQDALVAAARIVLAVRAIAADEKICRTATTGALAVEPGAVNVVPGRAVLGVELRDVGAAALDRAETRLEEAARDIAKSADVAVAVTRRTAVASAAAAPALQRVIAEAAGALGLSTMHLPSGAGHDAQPMAALAPMGMIFVPSAAGVSHAAEEFTSPEECVNGANVLLRVLLALDGGAG